LVVNTGFWSTGEIGRQIVRRFGHKYDFLFLSERVLGRRTDMLQAALLRADLVFCLNESGATMLRDSARVPLPPLITWIHHVTSWNQEHEAAARMSNLLVACTPSWRDRIASYAPGANVSYVRHGVDLDAFAPRTISRQAFGISGEAFVAGFFGARGSDLDAGRKGMDVLLAVFRRVAAAIPSLHAVFVGPGWESFASELRATGAHASVFGFVPHSRVSGMYSLLDVYLVTARVEGGPMTVLESLACGTPVVSTRVGLVPDVVIDGVNGFTAEVGDVDALAGALLRTATDVELRKALKSRARASVEKYTWTDMLAPLEAMLDGLIQLPPKRQGQPALAWIEDLDGTHKVCFAAECLATTITDLRRRRAPLVRSLRVLQDMLEGASFVDCCRALALLRGYGYRSRD
jgi:glycosyltransferase involved in cell wall biosynthesis